ncbi:MAG: replicative DNA helicase [Acidobacteria bacterium]|nr:replicative DNA helicase [Acidobacteriota bacterium]
MTQIPNEPTGSRPGTSSRVPPHSPEAEEAVLGAMLLSHEAIVNAQTKVSASDFYRPLFGQIFAAMVDLDQRGEPVDPVTLLEQMRARGVDIEPTLIGDLTANAVNIGNAEFYAELVREKAKQRALIQTASTIVDEAYATTDDVDGLFDRAEQSIMNIKDRGTDDSVAPLTELLQLELDRLEERDGTSGINGLATGYTALDEKLRGISPTALAIVGARPSVGKTAFALGIVTYVGTVLQRPALFFSLEMSRLEVAERILAAQARVDGEKLKTGQLSNVDWENVTKALASMNDSKVYVDDNPLLTVMDVRARARRIKQREGDLGVVVVDYLQLMSSRSRSENRQVEVSEMSRGLKLLARELETPVIALSQLSRSIEQRTGRRPMMSDLRESGAIEQDADIVMFLHRPSDSGEEESYADRGKIEVSIAKHRNGPTGEVFLAWVKNFAKFDNIAEFNSSYAE